jgi:hypothetical protein
LEIRFDSAWSRETRERTVDRFAPARVIQHGRDAALLVLPSSVTAESLHVMLQAKDRWNSEWAQLGLVDADAMSDVTAARVCVADCPEYSHVATIGLWRATPGERNRIAALLDGQVMTDYSGARIWSDAVHVAMHGSDDPLTRVRRLERLPYVQGATVHARVPLPIRDTVRRDRLRQRVAQWLAPRGYRIEQPVDVLGFAVPDRFFAVAVTTRGEQQQRSALFIAADGERMGVLGSDRNPQWEGDEAFGVTSADRSWLNDETLLQVKGMLPAHPFLAIVAYALRRPSPHADGAERLQSPQPSASNAGANTAPVPLEAALESAFVNQDAVAASSALAQALAKQDLHVVAVLAWLPDVESPLVWARDSARRVLQRSCRRIMDDDAADDLMLAAVVREVLQDRTGPCVQALAPGMRSYWDGDGRWTGAQRQAARELAAHPGAQRLRVAAPLAAAFQGFDRSVLRSVATPLEQAALSAALASCRARDGRFSDVVRTETLRRPTGRLAEAIANLPAACDPVLVTEARRRVRRAAYVDDGLSLTVPR